MSYQDINAETINRWIKEEDWEWGKAISHKDYIKALNGEWDVKLTPVKFVPHEWFGDLKAKKLLDDAGYKDKDGDGLREDKNGNKLSFNFAIRNTGAEYDQALADVFVKSWKEVGLDVKLVDGKLMSPKDFSQRVQADDPSIDIFQGAWQYGTNPNRQELLGKKAPLNLYRYTTEAFENSFKAQGSADMFDDAKLKAAYNKFDTEVAEELPFFPLSWDTSISFFNKRIKSYDLAKAKKNQFKLYDIELTANEGAK